MSKELQALERLRNTLLAEGYWQDVLQDVAIIETALKDYVHLYQLWNCKDSDAMIIQTTKTIHDENNKQLTALEIIKNKKVDVGQMIEAWQSFPFAFRHYMENWANYSFYLLTEEEFNLLNEVLL